MNLIIINTIIEKQHKISIICGAYDISIDIVFQKGTNKGNMNNIMIYSNDNGYLVFIAKCYKKTAKRLNKHCVA